MVKQDTYLVINKTLTPKFKSIKYFKQDLGKSLINDANKFAPHDVNIQKHLMFFDNILLKIGNIGNLKVYTNNKVKHKNIQICNGEKDMLYNIDDNMTLYDNINLALDMFFNKYIRIEKNVDISGDSDNQNNSGKTEKYIQPEKAVTEMTEEERILYARNR